MLCPTSFQFKLDLVELAVQPLLRAQLGLQRLLFFNQTPQRKTVWCKPMAVAVAALVRVPARELRV